jgi:hypothetical protein
MKNASKSIHLTAPRFIMSCVMILAMSLLSAGESDAKKKGGGKKKKAPAGANVIKSIDVKKAQFIVNRKTYIASDRVIVKIDNKTADFSKLKVGMKVIVASRVISYGKKVGTNTYEALRISAVSPKKK